MSLWRQLTRGVRALASRAARDRDFADEFDHFLDEAAAEAIARGVSPEEARRAARLQCGDASAVRDQVHASGWEHAVETLLGDVRYAARRLRRAPNYSLVVIVTLALGIGASTAVFSAVRPILFEPLPYPRPDRLMAIWDYTRDGDRLDVTFGTFRELDTRSRTFESLAVFRSWQPTVTGPAEAERLEGQRVTARYFRVLGVRPALGRDFHPSDDLVRGPRVVVLSDGLWRRRFGADAEIIGRLITLDDDAYEVIGVMPRHFEHLVSAAATIWTPLQYDASLPVEGREWGHHLRMLGRLHHEATLDAARQELDAIARTPVPEFVRVPWASLGNGLLMTPLQEDLTSGIRPALVAVLGAVLLVLGMACVNVANLTLAQGLRRQAEFAMRAALGAGRLRLIRQVVTEGLLLAALGGAAGTAMAVFALRWLVSRAPAGLPRASAIGIDGHALAFALAATIIIGLAVGVLPLRYAGVARLRTGVPGSPGHAAGHGLASRALVALEVALALVLLVSAGLLVRTLDNLFAISPGFTTGRLLTMQVQATGRRFDRETSQRFFDAALESVRKVPGVAAAALSSQLPLSGDRHEYGASFERDVERGGANAFPVFRYAVSPGYFATLGIPLRRGRVLDDHDATAAPLVTVVSESYARKFTGADAIGQRIYIGQISGPPYTVVGVVGDVTQTSLADPGADAVYVAPRQWPFSDSARWLVVRTHGPPEPLAAAVREAVWSVDRGQPVVRIATMERLLIESTGVRHFALVLFQVFGAAALVLVATGVYAVVAGSVQQRTREIGVRLALGASPGRVLGLVLAQGMAVSFGGLMVGLAGSAAASGALMTLLFGVSPLDPATYASVIVLLLVVSAAACAIPAWRASRVDPSVTLRAE
ncbi:MAG TPA: ABC transporter permease [Vicinamibacterales bacterium]|nr:ABC transporter permease [Vicinamibacterales bacterium]